MPRAIHNPKPTGLPPEPTKDEARTEFARRLQDRRTKKGWSQSDLGRRAGAFVEGGKFGRDNISNYERGVSTPNPKHLNALARALDTTPSDLMPSRGIPSDDRVVPFSLTMTDDGLTYLRINQKLPFAAASEIMAILARVGAVVTPEA